MHNLKILVVDDEMGMRLGTVRALRNFSIRLPDVEGDIHFEFDQAESGEEALEKIEAAPPDLVLLDHKLPGIQGLDVLDHIITKQYDLLAVMITAYASLETAVAATKRGAYDFLAKPFTPEELKACVQKTAKHLILQRQAKKLAQEKRQVRFQFLSVLAHELKSPLAAIEGYLRIMQDHSAGDSMSEYDPMVERCLVRLDGMRKMIFDMLDLTRIESGQKKREIAMVDLCDVARTAIESVLPDATKRGIDVSLVAESPVALLADRGEMDIIFNNLVSNSVKYNRDKGNVEIRLEKSSDLIRIQVKDTGIGMSKEESSRLFKEFTRIKNSKTKTIMGSGLGLSIVKKLALIYEGDASVDSEPDVGSTFTVTLDPNSQANAHADIV